MEGLGIIAFASELKLRCDHGPQLFGCGGVQLLAALCNRVESVLFTSNGGMDEDLGAKLINAKIARNLGEG